MRLNGLRARNLWRKRKRQVSPNVKGSLLDPLFLQHSPDLGLEARVYLVYRLDCNCSFICYGSDGERQDLLAFWLEKKKKNPPHPSFRVNV
jgi:hypothetical protein